MHPLTFLLVVTALREPCGPAGTLQNDLAGLFPGDRCGKVQRHIGNGQAVHLGIFPLASKMGREGLTRLKVQDLVLVRGDAACGRHALPPDQADARL